MLVRLTNGYDCKIDEKDYDLFCSLKFYGSKTSDGHVYAKNILKRKSAFLHRLIMNAKKGQLVDHINGDTLDNRRKNLRIANPSENNFNQKSKQSKYGRGVSKASGNRKKPFYAKLNFYNKAVGIGYFETPALAQKAVIEKAKELFGEFNMWDSRDLT